MLGCHLQYKPKQSLSPLQNKNKKKKFEFFQDNTWEIKFTCCEL